MSIGSHMKGFCLTNLSTAFELDGPPIVTRRRDGFDQARFRYIGRVMDGTKPSASIVDVGDDVQNWIITEVIPQQIAGPVWAIDAVGIGIGADGDDSSKNLRIELQTFDTPEDVDYPVTANGGKYEVGRLYSITDSPPDQDEVFVEPLYSAAFSDGKYFHLGSDATAGYWSQDTSVDYWGAHYDVWVWRLVHIEAVRVIEETDFWQVRKTFMRISDWYAPTGSAANTAREIWRWAKNIT